MDGRAGVQPTETNRSVGNDELRGPSASETPDELMSVPLTIREVVRRGRVDRNELDRLRAEIERLRLRRRVGRASAPSQTGSRADKWGRPNRRQRAGGGRRAGAGGATTREVADRFGFSQMGDRGHLAVLARRLTQASAKSGETDQLDSTDVERRFGQGCERESGVLAPGFLDGKRAAGYEHHSMLQRVVEECRRVHAVEVHPKEQPALRWSERPRCQE